MEEESPQMRTMLLFPISTEYILHFVEASLLLNVLINDYIYCATSQLYFELDFSSFIVADL